MKTEIKILEAKQKELLTQMAAIRNDPQTPRFFASKVSHLRAEYHQIQNQISLILNQSKSQ